MLKKCNISSFFFAFFIIFHASTSFSQTELSEKQYKKQLESLVQLANKNIKIKKKNFIKNAPKDQSLCDKSCIQRKLKHMAEVDQMIRVDVWNAPIVNEMIGKHIFEKNNQSLLKLIEKIDNENTAELKKLLVLTPWFTISEFGQSAVNDAWIIVQHSPDIDFQHRVIFILEHLPRHEISLENYALLYDRLCSYYPALNIKQRYGTQFHGEAGTLKLYPYEGTWLELNKRRKAMGLDSMESYLRRLKERFPLAQITIK